MKVYTKVVIDMNTDEVLEEESYEHTGEVAQALGGGGGGTNTVQKADPWEGVQPYLSADRGDHVATGQFNEAERLYNEGSGTQYYTGNTVAGFNPIQRQAQQAMYDRAQGGSALNQSAQNLNLQTTQGGFLGGDPTTKYAQQFAQQGGGTMGGLQQNIGNIASGQQSNPAQGYLNTMAQGGTNPYLDKMYGRAADIATKKFTEGTLPAIQSRASGAGRYGSPAMERMVNTAAGQFGESLTGMAANMYGQQYNADMNRQLQASQALGGLGGQGTAQQLQAAGMLQGAQRGDIGQQLQATGMLGEAYGSERNRMQQAQQMAGNLANEDYRDIGMMGQVGQQQQAMAQRQIDADRQRWDFNQNKDWANLGRYQQSLQGGFPTQSDSSSGMSPMSPMGGAIAGGMVGYGMGSVGMLGASNPYAAAIGAGLGYASTRM